VTTLEEAMYKLAKARNARVQWWWGRSGSSGTVRRYTCYLCDTCIDTESASYPMTKHAEEAIDEHCKEHEADAQELIDSGLTPIPAKLVKKLHQYKLDIDKLGCRTVANTLCGPDAVLFVLEAGLGRLTKPTLQRAVNDQDFYDALQAAAQVSNDAVRSVATAQAA
jgi:hypothetical protein